MYTGCREDTNPWEILGISADWASNRASSRVGIARGDAGAATKVGRLQGHGGQPKGKYSRIRTGIFDLLRVKQARPLTP